MKTKSVPLLLSALFGLAAFNTVAAETPFQQFYQQQNDAYASYRAALFQTNKKDQAASLKGISKFNQQWQQVIQQFSNNPPEIFVTDNQWQPTLDKIANIAARGTLQIEQGELSEAHETLEEIRDELSQLRSRNHLNFFSDHVNNYHEQMEQLLQARYQKETLDNTAKLTIREQLAILDYLADEIIAHAPENYRNDVGYTKLQQGLSASLTRLRAALDSEDPATIIQAIQGLKPAYAKLFVKFG